MNDIRFVDSAISELLDLKTDSRLNLTMRDQIDHLLSGLRFLQLYGQCLAKWNEALQGKKNRHLGAVRNPQIKATLAGATRGLYNTGIAALATQDFQDWSNLASNLLGRIKLSVPSIKEDCLYLLDCSFQCRFSSSELQNFFRNLSTSLDEIVRLKSDKIVGIEMQIQGMKEKLHLFAQIFELTRKMRSSNKDLKDFNLRIQSWAFNAACLSLLYWVHAENRGEILPRMKIFLSTPEVTRMFLAVLRHLWWLSHNRLLMDEGVPKFVDFLLEILQLFSLRDGIQNLRSNLIFLTTFLIDPPTAEEYRDDVESIAKEVQSQICSLNSNEIQRGTAVDFQEKFVTINGKVSEVYNRIFLDSTSFDFPRINVSGFIDSLIDNLREISDGVQHHKVDKMLEDLLSLRHLLYDILMKNMDLYEDLWRRIINVVYRAKIAVNMISCLNHCVWYDMKFLSDVRVEINLINSEESQQFHDTEMSSNASSSNSNKMPPLSFQSRLDEVVVGFKDDFDILVDLLLRGSRRLEIVSIVGTAGQGKTNLAMKIFSHAPVKRHFHRRAWCTVTQTYRSKKLLVDILNMLSIDCDISNTEEECLVELLRRALKGRRYLIVLDDVWDTWYFNHLKPAFPDDHNGSRILLTTRNREVAAEISKEYGTNSAYIRNLHPLSYSESWDLLQRKLFHRDDHHLDPTFVEVGNQIARNCNGLPLAIVVIAGLLLQKVDNLDWWNHVAENLDSLIASNWAMDFVELSYNHLPDHLKPCFLYFGAFQANKVIRARRLIQLWVSEGFIPKSRGKSLENVAMEYLRDLVSRSLVVVTNTSSTGGIKTCRIDSLFYEFCLAKVKEEKFLQVESGDDISFKSRGKIYKNYRICIQSGGDGFFASNPWGPCVHSLLFVPDYTCLNKGELFSICNFKLLHILDLEDMEFNGYFPEEVTLLVLLRYLAIWCPSGIFSIPRSIANLRNLETFRVKREVRFGDEICLPDTLWKMKRLRHVDVGGFTASFSGDGEADEESLALDNIQTFSAPSLRYGEDAEKLLRRLPKVRKLRCQFDDFYDPDFHQQQNRFLTLDFLNELESLNVRYVGSLFYQNAFNFPATLKKLSLAQFMIPWSEMSTIAKNLHNLEVLKLLKDAFDGEVWNVSDEEFHNLKSLKLCELNIAKWNVSVDAFPYLEQLIVENCDQLVEIPSEIGWAPTLNKIQVRWCKPTVVNSARLIKEEQEECGNSDIVLVLM